MFSATEFRVDPLHTPLYTLLADNANLFAPVVSFNPSTDRLLRMDFTSANQQLTEEIINDTSHFAAYIEQQLQGYEYGVGGYNEHRTVYARSTYFNTADEPRRLHLGVDVWGPADIRIYAPLNATVHSFAFNNHYGDYGATIILQHQLNGATFHTLYGHLSLKDLEGLTEGLSINKGEAFAHFGTPEENGHWPPHLHFQVIENMMGVKGDYPGVCKLSERNQYLINCPDADLILQMMQFA